MPAWWRASAARVTSVTRLKKASPGAAAARASARRAVASSARASTHRINGSTSGSASEEKAQPQGNTRGRVDRPTAGAIAASAVAREPHREHLAPFGDDMFSEEDAALLVLTGYRQEFPCDPAQQTLVSDSEAARCEVSGDQHCPRKLRHRFARLKQSDLPELVI